jgi:hypothetical protein
MKVDQEDILAIGLLLLSEQRAGGGRYGKVKYLPTKKTKRRTGKKIGQPQKSNCKR